MPLAIRAAVPPALVLSLALAAGCSDPAKVRAPVSGKVTIEKKTPGVSGVIISFVGPDNKTVTAEVGADGSYQASGVMVGENKISVNFNTASPPPRPDYSTLTKEQAEAAKKKEEEERLKAANAPGNPVPAKYNDPNASGLKFPVEKGDNTYNVDLKK